MPACARDRRRASGERGHERPAGIGHLGEYDLERAERRLSELQGRERRSASRQLLRKRFDGDGLARSLCAAHCVQSRDRRGGRIAARDAREHGVALFLVQPDEARHGSGCLSGEDGDLIGGALFA